MIWLHNLLLVWRSIRDIPLLPSLLLFESIPHWTKGHSSHPLPQYQRSERYNICQCFFSEIFQSFLRHCWDWKYSNSRIDRLCLLTRSGNPWTLIVPGWSAAPFSSSLDIPTISSYSFLISNREIPEDQPASICSTIHIPVQVFTCLTNVLPLPSMLTYFLSLCPNLESPTNSVSLFSFRMSAITSLSSPSFSSLTWIQPSTVSVNPLIDKGRRGRMGEED